MKFVFNNDAVNNPTRVKVRRASLIRKPHEFASVPLPGAVPPNPYRRVPQFSIPRRIHFRVNNFSSFDQFFVRREIPR